MKILIADDHPLFRMGLVYALKAQGFEIVAEAGDGLEAVAACAATPPEVALLDVKMPNLNGIEACAQIRRANPKVLVLMLSTFDEPAIIKAARDAGATAYLSKETDPQELAATIRRIAAEPGRDWLPNPDVPELTAREAQVLSLLVQGYSNKAIAKALALSPETVKDYLNGVYRKLEVGDRLQAVQKARILGLA